MSKPNIVFIMTDNQGAWSLGCYGNPDIRTPHIDGLAQSGMRFFCNMQILSTIFGRMVVAKQGG